MKRTLFILFALTCLATAQDAVPAEAATDPTLATTAATTEQGEATATLSDANAIPEANLPKLQEENKRNAIGVFADVNVGTQGVGFDVGYEFNRYVKMRFRAAFLSYKYDTDWDDAEVSAKLSGNNSGLLMDVHPFAGKFRVTAGFNFNPLSVAAHGTLKSDYNIGQYGGKTYTWGNYEYRVKDGASDSDAWVDAKYKWRSFQPYLGIGWSSDGDGDRSLYFHFDLGVNFMGSGKFSISSGSAVEQRPLGSEKWDDVDNALLRDSVMDEGKDFFKIADKIYVYPVLQMGIGFRF